MLKEKNCLKRLLLVFWAVYFFIKCPHIFKNTPWGRVAPFLIEKPLFHMY